MYFVLGEQWHDKRKTLTPAFHFSILLEFVNTFNNHTKCFIERLEKYHLNETVDIVPLISDFTLAAVQGNSGTFLTSRVISFIFIFLS